MFSLRCFGRNFSAKTFCLIFFNNFVGRDVSSDFVGRLVASKIVWGRFLCTDVSSKVFLYGFFFRDCLVEIFLQGFFGSYFQIFFV